MVLRGKARDGTLHEVVVKIESVSLAVGLSTIIRIEPHVIVSNRTGFNVNLMLPEAIIKPQRSMSAAQIQQQQFQMPLGAGATGTACNLRLDVDSVIEMFEASVCIQIWMSWKCEPLGVA